MARRVRVQCERCNWFLQFLLLLNFHVSGWQTSGQTLEQRKEGGGRLLMGCSMSAAIMVWYGYLASKGGSVFMYS